ncbi:UvrD-helicase domain-containing protein [Sinirhodobacter sp. WL0062]|uniref:DNA 3'-5' helicase n=1 Tax=Rhodobacter flavimaris TaxID=2907145 RepID=A0ABS8YY58_9RHOB|nr:UvrD-helicase domain-containing protein [Sinirhodobacter sp. WL0062]MCE5974623.1 UvrD-helicase domain-containing protein [Sinirhodobacter sp. WL0062]
MSGFDEDDAFEGALSLSQRAMGAMRGSVPDAEQGYLNGLNPAQREAAVTLDGPVLILAGAGTGKTSTLMARATHLVRTGRARPNEILAVTFTNKAAREMSDRLRNPPYSDKKGEVHAERSDRLVIELPWLGTFHSVCVKLLRRHAELVGLKPNFTILDTDDQIRLLKQLIVAANMDEKRWPARQLAGIIDGWKNRALTPDRVKGAETAAFNNRGSELYAAYQERLRTLNAVDFGDLLLHMVSIFQTHKDVLEQYQRRFKYILVDEYQDTNVAQYLWLRLLAQGHRNICCVGDDDQSIYGWRGAEVGNILRFEKDFPGAAVIRLEQNYRSTPHILAVATQLIARNQERLGKTLKTDAKEGERVQLASHWDGEEEARRIGEKIEDLKSGRAREARERLNLRSIRLDAELRRFAEHGIRWTTRRDLARWAFVSGRAYNDEKVRNLITWLLQKEANASYLSKYKSVWDSPLDRFNFNEMAILVRASHQMRAFEDRFLTIGLPYRVVGGPRFYERLEIRDAMAYFRLAVSPDDDLAFERVVNTPKRGLGDKAQNTIQRAARENGLSLFDGARLVLQSGEMSGKAAGQLRLFVENIARWHEAVRGASPATATSPAEDDDALIELEADAVPPANDHSHIRLVEQILEDSGYVQMWLNDKTPEAPGRLENLKELFKALEQFENLQGFLEHVALIMDNDRDEGDQKVTIMTLHAAKGLEFPVVFLPGWEDGLFPSQRSMDEAPRKGLEEERRLAYVGITRAEELCTISFAGNRRVYGQWQSQLPSRFIDELPAAHVEVLPSGMAGGGFGAASAYGRGGIEERASRADVYASPGWQRMQSRGVSSQPQRRGAMIIDAETVAFEIGERVFHKKFGYGEVLGSEGDKIVVAFDKADTKKLLASFVVPADEAGDVPF